jgi:mono/diheme cytochrome c family protein
MARVPLLVAALTAAVVFGAVMVLSEGEEVDLERAPPASAGLQVFNRMGCGSCHRLAAAGSTGPVGPNLDERLESYTARSLKARITAPVVGSAMPGDFDERMSDAELDALVAFLLASGTGARPE